MNADRLDVSSRSSMVCHNKLSVALSLRNADDFDAQSPQPLMKTRPDYTFPPRYPYSRSSVGIGAREPARSARI